VEHFSGLFSTYGIFVPFFHVIVCEKHATLAVASGHGPRGAARSPRLALDGAVDAIDGRAPRAKNRGPRPTGDGSRPTGRGASAHGPRATVLVVRFRANGAGGAAQVLRVIHKVVKN